MEGNSIGKTLHEDIQTWNELKQGLIPPDIKRQRLEELIGEKNFNTHLSWDKAFKNVAFAKRQYMKAMLLNGEDLSKPPRIKVSTIHGAKGGEATNVVLFLNQTANTIKGSKKSQAKQEEEFRVWYVGVTRTMENLFLVLELLMEKYLKPKEVIIDLVMIPFLFHWDTIKHLVKLNIMKKLKLIIDRELF